MAGMSEATALEVVKTLATLEKSSRDQVELLKEIRDALIGGVEVPEEEPAANGAAVVGGSANGTPAPEGEGKVAKLMKRFEEKLLARFGSADDIAIEAALSKLDSL